MRFAFKMFLKPGCEEEYQKRHNAIWPELVKMIKDGGVSNYSISGTRTPTFCLAIRNVRGKGIPKTLPTA